jgi:TolA-binding protein
MSQREAEAYAALFRLGLPMMPVEAGAAPSASGYLKLAGEYPHTGAGQQAMLLAAGVLYKSGNYAEARVQFEKYLNQHGDSLLAPTAAFGLASALDALNQIDDAQKALQAVISHYPTSSVVPQAKLALARLFETKKQPDQALKIYDQLAQSTTADTWAAEARMRREELLVRFPALAPVEPASLPGALGANPPSLLSTTPGSKPASRPSTGAVPAKVGTNSATTGPSKH